MLPNNVIGDQMITINQIGDPDHLTYIFLYRNEPQKRRSSYRTDFVHWGRITEAL